MDEGRSLSAIDASHPAISSYVARAIQQCQLAQPATILDLPCGFGRHSRWLASVGHFVAAVDIDPARVARVIEPGTNGDAGNIWAVVANANHAFPFGPDIFDMVVMVHFITANVVSYARRVIRPNGYFLFESFGAQGQNWRDLPAPGSMAKELGDDFELLDYRERLAGPTRAEAAVVKFLARRK